MDNDLLFRDGIHPMVRACELVGERWASAVCPVYVNPEKRSVTAQGLGTMFVGAIDGKLYLVTADHVIAASQSYEFRVLHLQGRAVDTVHMNFQGSQSCDIAVHEMNAFTSPTLVGGLYKHIPIAEDLSGWTETGIFSLLGYPSTKNVLKARFGSTNRHAFNIIATRISNPSRRTQIENAFALEYSPRNATDGAGAKINPPDLHGMSGGPCIELMLKQNPDGWSLRAKLKGVITEYHPQDRQIIVSPISNAISSRLFEGPPHDLPDGLRGAGDP